MTILRDISIIWSMFHVLVLFIFLYQSRYSKKQTIIANVVVAFVWIGLHTAILLWKGPIALTRWIFFTGTLPSLAFFWFMSKQRDGRFLFTFCLCDTLSAEILLLTNLIDAYVFGGKFISMLILRLLLFPLLELFAYRVIRPILTEVQKSVRTGWYGFAAVTVAFYLALLIIGSEPSLIGSVKMLPINLLLCLLMPLMYWNIFQALRRQQKIYELAEQDNILKLQVSNMQQRLAQFSAADEKFRIERHDMRHRLHTVAEMVQKGEVEELKSYLNSVEEKLEGASVKRYCANPVLDAVFLFYFRAAEQLGIKVNYSLAIPEALGVDMAELSTVFANAIENAINACKRLPQEKRLIEVRAVSHPQLIIQIINPYEGEVEMDQKGIPVTEEIGHGFGTRSIVAFCEKHGAFYEFIAEEGSFSLRIVLQNA